jgi:predicted transcriptional regulator
VLAKRLGVTQAYISKVERQTKVTPKLAMSREMLNE